MQKQQSRGSFSFQNSPAKDDAIFNSSKKRVKKVEHNWLWLHEMRLIGNEYISVPTYNMTKIFKKLARKEGPRLVKIEEARKNARLLNAEAIKLIDKGNRLMEKANFQHQILDATTKELANDMAEDSGQNAYQDSSDE